jgi:hypothetical protein
MNARRVELVLWALALPLAGTAGGRARFERVDAHAAPAWTTAPPVVRRAPADSLAAGSSIIVERDLFRLDRRPSPVAYTPAAADAPPRPPHPPKPALVITGIVGGPPWEALLEGIPGRAEAAVVRRGDVFGDSTARLTIKRVGRDTVIVVGMDTTWALTVRRAWE